MEQGRGTSVLAVTLAMLALSTVFVFLRLVSRAGIVRRVTLDDYFIVLAWILSFGVCFSICYGVKFGLGQHQSTISNSDAASLNRLEYSFSVLYNPALMATKTSILAFYLTLSKTQRVFRWTTIGTLVIVNAAGLALTFLNIFQCHPITSIFEQPKPAGAHCDDIITLYLSSSPVNIITDLLILLLPLPVLKNMRLPRKQKWILYLTFSAGIFVTVVDVIRIAYLQAATLAKFNADNSGQSNDGLTSQSSQADFAWNISLSYMWSAVEVNVGIMCACVPGIKPLVARFLPQALKDASTTSRDTYGSRTSVDDELSAPKERIPSLSSDQVRALPPLRTRNVSDADMGIMDFLACRDGHSHPTMGRRSTLLSNPTSPTSPKSPKSNRRRTISDADMGTMDFLANEDRYSSSTLDRRATILTHATVNTETGNPAFFDFINMNPQKSIVNMSNRESVRPIAEVTVLFFLWGFAYGLLNSLNSEFQIAAQLSNGQTVAIHSAYYLGYLIGPLTVGRWTLKHWGFKACYIIGLVIYGTGTLVFWPSAVLTSFGGFFASNVIVGFGLSILETAANPFIALCGPPAFAEVRLNFSQAVQAVGTVVSPLLAVKVLFKDAVNDAPTLIDTQWTYLALTLFTFLLAFIYYVIKIPEVTDDELEEASAECLQGNLPSLRKSKVVWLTLGLAILAQFIYVGGQEAVATSMEQYLTSVQPSSDFINFETVGHALFAASRFLAAFLGLFIKPRYLLAFFLTGTLVFSILAMDFSGFTSSAMIQGILFFEGPLFPLIFAIALHGMGQYTKDAAALLAASISGGGVFPPVQNAVAQARGIQYSYCVIVAITAFGMLFPAYLNLVPAAKIQTNPVKSDFSRRVSTTSSQYSQRAVRALSFFKNRRHSTASGDGHGTVEHVEEIGEKQQQQQQPQRGSPDSLTFETSALETL